MVKSSNKEIRYRLHGEAKPPPKFCINTWVVVLFYNNFFSFFQNGWPENAKCQANQISC